MRQTDLGYLGPPFGSELLYGYIDCSSDLNQTEIVKSDQMCLRKLGLAWNSVRFCVKRRNNFLILCLFSTAVTLPERLLLFDTNETNWIRHSIMAIIRPPKIKLAVIITIITLITTYV